MFAAVILVVILIFAGIKIVQTAASDPTVKELNKLEGQKVEIISSKIVASVSDGEVLAEDVINFSVSYNYRLLSGTIKQYTQESGLKIKVSDTALAATVNNSSIQITNGAQDGAQLTVTVTYKKLSQTFNYTIKTPQAQQ